MQLGKFPVKTYRMIDIKDALIVSMLRNNARMPLTKISRETQIPVSTIFDKIKKQEDRIIKRHTCLLDFKKLGYNINTIVLVNLTVKDGFSEFVLSHPNVNTAYKTTNGADFTLECIFRNMHELNEFVESVESKFAASSVQVLYALDEIKREAFMSDYSLLNCQTPLVKEL